MKSIVQGVRRKAQLRHINAPVPDVRRMIQSFLLELRRRKVLRVLGAYAIVAWGILQGADTLLPRLGLPDWTFTLVAVLLLFGMPICAVVVWAFELTPEGVRRAPAASTPDQTVAAEHVSGWWLELGMLAVLIGVILISGYQIASRAPTKDSVESLTSADPATPSVAVLPFASFSTDPEDGYFADGLTEELINSLAQISGLLVPGRTSSFYFKGRNEDLRDIAGKLNVAHLLEGSVRRDGDRLRVTVQLISAADGFHLWSRTYDRERTDIFAIQQDIATQVAGQLHRTLIADGPVPAAAASGSDTYSSFLVATALLRESSRDSLDRARALFEEILALEPDNVEALAGHARATIRLASAYLTLDFETSARIASSAVERALDIAPDSIAANLSAGIVYHTIAFRIDEQQYFDLADRALSRALQLAPEDAEVLRAYGSLLSQTGRVEEALDAIRRGFERDPLNRSAQLLLAEAYRNVGQLGAARQELEDILEGEPQYLAARLELAEMLIEGGQLVEALPHLRIVHDARVMPRATFALANVLLNLNRLEAARGAVAELDYAPLSMPLGEMVLKMITADDQAALTFAESELKRTNDRIWRPLVILLALNTGDLDKAREQLRALEPGLLVSEPDLSRAVPVVVLFAGNLLAREGHDEQARELMESLLKRLAPSPTGFDPVANKILRAHANAQLGRVEEVIAELSAAQIQGYRTLFDFDYFMRLDRYPTFAGIRDVAGVRAVIDRIASENRRAGSAQR